MPSAPLLPITTLRNVAPFSTRNTGSWPSSCEPSPSPEPAVKRRQPPSYVPLVTRMVSLTVVCEPLVPHDDPVMLPVGGGAGVGVGVGLGEGDGVGDGAGEPLGTEHSFTAFSGAGSDPKVATLHEKLPFKTLNTNLSAAPNATLVDWDTEQLSPILQIVT